MAELGAFAGSAIPERIRIKRFEYSMVQARLLLLRRAVHALPTAEFFFFFSETDAPIGSCSAMQRFLAHKRGGSFVQGETFEPHALLVGDPNWHKAYAATSNVWHHSRAPAAALA